MLYAKRKMQNARRKKMQSMSYGFCAACVLCVPRANKAAN